MVGNILGGTVVEALFTRVRTQGYHATDIAVVGLESWVVGRGLGNYGTVSLNKVRNTSELQMPLKKVPRVRSGAEDTFVSIYRDKGPSRT